MSEIKDHLVIPIKPLAVTAVNAAALASAAIASAGTVAAATMTGGALLAGAAVKGRSQVRKAALRKTGALPTRSRSTPRARSLPGLKSTPIKTRRLASSSPAAKATRAAKAVATHARSAGSRLIPKSLQRAATQTRSAVSRSPLGRSMKRGTARTSNGLKRAIGLPVSRSHRSRPVSRPMMRKARGWFRHVVLGKNPIKKNAATKDVKSKVNRALINPVVDFTAPLSPATLKPGSSPVTVAPAVSGMTPTSGKVGTMKQYAQQMVAYAAEYDAPGILEIIDELDNNIHDALRLVAEAFDSLSETARRKWPFDDAIVQKLSMTGECLWTAVNMARQIVPDIETIHEAELRKLRNPDRPGMEKFDLAANGKA